MRRESRMAIAREILTTGRIEDTVKPATKKASSLCRRGLGSTDLASSYRRAAGTFAASGAAEGIVVTRP
jgi:hypothetical protein